MGAMTTIGAIDTTPTNYTAADANDVYSHLQGIDEALLAAGNRCGQIVIWPMETVPDWLLICDGSRLKVSEYPDLYAAIGNTYGGDSVHFYIPAMSLGMFVVNKDSGAGVNTLDTSRTDRGDGTSGDEVGTLYLTGRELTHNHGMNRNTNNRTGGGGGIVRNGSSSTGFTSFDGGNESRPININVIFCIVWGAG